MRAVLAPLGFENVLNPKDADLILINTCSIRDKAEAKTHSFAGDLKSLKADKPELIIGITGCVAQQEKEKLLQDLPYIDLVLGPDNIDELPWILEDLSQPVIRADFGPSDRVWKTDTKLINPGPSVFVSIMKGCDHFCAYCVVPYTRGREKSRPINDIIVDLRQLVAKGVREITFLGQNINTFGKRTGESLHELFYRAHEIEGLERIRFTTSHPGDLRDELIRCFEDLPKLCSQFHLPVQSGSNQVLRTMRRFYTREQYLERVRALRQARPDIAFSSDFIVAFPGETDEDFEATCSLAREVDYDNAYSFIYSPRPGTAAFQRKSTITEGEKAERLLKLQTILRESSRRLHEAEVGRVKEILIESVSKKDVTKWTGRTSQNVPVHIDRNGCDVGDIVEVLVKSATLTHLKAELLRVAKAAQTPKILAAPQATKSQPDSLHC